MFTFGVVNSLFLEYKMRTVVSPAVKKNTTQVLYIKQVQTD